MPEIKEILVEIDCKVNRLDERIYNLGGAVRVLQSDMSEVKTSMTGMKKDISWIKWGIGVSFSSILTAMLYLVSRQNSLGDQMINLLQQIADK